MSNPPSPLDENTELLLDKMLQFASEHGTPSTKRISIGECATCKETRNVFRERISQLIEEARKEGRANYIRNMPL